MQKVAKILAKIFSPPKKLNDRRHANLIQSRCICAIRNPQLQSLSIHKNLQNIKYVVTFDETKFVFLYRVTVGVLQTSLALEEELSLKAQLQKLLTVAKNLFTHLGIEKKSLFCIPAPN